MPFDPTIPKEQTEIDAVELRNQFNGLKAIFDLQIAALQSQLNSLAPVFNYLGNGAYSWQWNGANPNLWRFEFSADAQNWQNYGSAQGSDRDGEGTVDQNGFYRILGTNAAGQQITPVSNAVQVQDM